MKKLIAIAVFFAFIALPIASPAAANGVGKVVKCPICGDTVTPKTAKESWTYKGKKYYFAACCSKKDIAKFKKNPQKYLKK
ncbi:MAG: YHS domain-containing protein [Nitrospirota bacterium]